MKTIEEVENYLRSQKVSGVMAVRIRNLSKRFSSLEEFFSAKKSEIERTYNGMTPDSKHGIGGKFWPIFSMAKNYFKGIVGNEEEHNDEPVVEDSGRKAAVVLMRMHSFSEMKSIVDMMEFCGIESINFLEIAGFLENVRFRQKNPDEKSPDRVQDGAGNAKQA